MAKNPGGMSLNRLEYIEYIEGRIPDVLARVRVLVYIYILYRYTRKLLVYEYASSSARVYTRRVDDWKLESSCIYGI